LVVDLTDASETAAPMESSEQTVESHRGAAEPSSEATPVAVADLAVPLAGELDDASRTLTSLAGLFEQGAGELRNGAQHLADSERRLAESQQRLAETERKLAASEQDLATEREARRQEQARVASLEAEVASRDDLLAAVRTKLSDLSGTLAPSS
jgi:chromosome segregation ATPase